MPASRHGSRARPGRARIHRGLAVTCPIAFVVGVVACGTTPSAAPKGAECFLATDCAPGLVCVEQANKSRICTDDLSRVSGTRPPDASMGEAGEAGEGGEGGGSDATVVDAPLESSPTDTGVKDTGGPVLDAGADG